ncbi:TniQ family protein, partial [Ralstonia sp. ASV6]|uniref:TniQ family protein n=1 Tax=Ralstonia sp. ASV6 TaxID=2795124 RepID=UPI0034D326BB
MLRRFTRSSGRRNGLTPARWIHAVTSRRQSGGRLSRACDVALAVAWLLPVHPHPRPDELLSSWMLRLAHGNGLKVHSFCQSYFGRDKQVWNRNIDVLAPSWLLAGLSELSGIPQSTIEATSLHKFESLVFEQINLYGATRWLLPAGVYHRTRKCHGMQYCPACLSTDAVPYFRARWCLAFYTECDVHRVLMQDACHVCDAPIAFFRGDIGHKSQLEAHPPTRCHRCGTDITRAPALHYAWPDGRVAEIFHALLSLCCKRPAIPPCQSNCVVSESIFSAPGANCEEAARQCGCSGGLAVG